MASLVGFGRFGRGLFLLVLVGVIAGCGSDGEVSAPSSDPSTTAVADADLEMDEFEIVDTSMFTDAFYPEITEDDILIIGMGDDLSYRYDFPTRELSDGVSFDLEARWDPVDGGLQSSLEWNLTGDETSPSDFAFIASLPKDFAETVDDIVFDPPPDKIIETDPTIEWIIDFLVSSEVSMSATSEVGQDDGLAQDAVGLILAQANSIRRYSELSSCARWRPDVPAVARCYLAVVADNAGHFREHCDALGSTLYEIDPKVRWEMMFSAACRAVDGLVRYGTPVSCDDTVDWINRSGCQKMVWEVLAGACRKPGDSDYQGVLDHQICLYEATVTVGAETYCETLEMLGSPEMANDCRAAITKDPSWCAKTADPGLRASCCENFRGTDAYDTCLASIGERDPGESTSTTTGEDTTTTATEDTATTEPGEEDLPPAIPTGVYTGSFDARIIADYFWLDSGVPHINTINILIDDFGLISGDLYAYQTGSMLGCPGADMKYLATIDPGQVIGPTLPQTVTATLEMTWHETFASKNQEIECIPPVAVTEVSSESLVFESIQNGVLTGIAGDYLQFELE